MKKLLQLLVCLLHPLAVVLIWIDLPRRTDIEGTANSGRSGTVLRQRARLAGGR